MNNIKLYLIALVIFTVIDGLWLGLIAKNLYRKELGFLLADNPNWMAAVIFYLLFLVGLVYFVLNPAVAKEDVYFLVTSAALFGLITYATYDLTNLATIKDWPLKITIIDLIWGTFLSTTVSLVTYYVYMLIK